MVKNVWSMDEDSVALMTDITIILIMFVIIIIIFFIIIFTIVTVM